MSQEPASEALAIAALAKCLVYYVVHTSQMQIWKV